MTTRANAENINIRALNSLVWSAAHRTTLTFENFVGNLGLHPEDNLTVPRVNKVLTELYHWCEKKNLPMLTSLVVRKSGGDTGLPGRAWWHLFETNVRWGQKPDLANKDVKTLTLAEKRAITRDIHLECFQYYDDAWPKPNFEIADDSIVALTEAPLNNGIDATRLARINKPAVTINIGGDSPLMVSFSIPDKDATSLTRKDISKAIESGRPVIDFILSEYLEHSCKVWINKKDT